jgi:hypothetical protein
MAEFTSGLLRDLELQGEEAQPRAEGERKRLRRADREAKRLRGMLRGLENKRERLMNLALDDSFGKDEILMLGWSRGGRTLLPAMGSESFVHRRIYAPDDA